MSFKKIYKKYRIRSIVMQRKHCCWRNKF